MDERGERTDLWTVDYRGGAPRRLTTSPGSDSAPRLSPDGGRLAFLRAGQDGVAQPHLLDLPDGEPRPLAAFRHGVRELDWAPDGQWLVAAAPDDTAAGDTARVYTTLGWRADGEDGGLAPPPIHLHRIDLDATITRLTAGAWSARRPRVGADGVYFLADPRPDADLDPCPQVHRVGMDGAMVQQSALAGPVHRYHLVPGGLRVLGHDVPRPRDAQPRRWFELRAGAPVRSLPAPQGWPGLLGEESDVFDWRLELDDDPTLSTATGGGNCWPVEVATGAALEIGPGLCGALAGHGERRVAVLALGTGAQAPDVYALEPGGPRRLTDHGRWLAAFAAPDWEAIEAPGPGGPITVHLLRPAGASGPLPTVLLVHGGPTGQWGVVAPLEASLLAAAGLQVAMPNIRGSIDRGPEWVSPLYGAWGRVDAEDCHAVCDHLVATGRTDPGRLGVAGLSYGGFLTQWLIGVSDRFAAAVAENGVSNQIAAWALCADGLPYNRAAGLGEPLTMDGVARLWSTSPLRNAARIRTPLLMLQAADDRTCPAADNEQLFVALRALRREVVYVVYPEEGHLMQGTGRLDRRLDRHTRTVAWFVRHLLAQDGA